MAQRSMHNPQGFHPLSQYLRVRHFPLEINMGTALTKTVFFFFSGTHIS